MGYTTEFEGRFNVSPALKPEHTEYLRTFARTRRMVRDANVAEAMPDAARLAVGLPIGPDGEYFVGGTGHYGQDDDESVVDYNEPPPGQPGLWCKWEPSDDGAAIEWNGVEKFYDYVEWIEYIVVNFLKPWGYELNGEVCWNGEESGDLGKIVIAGNVVSEQRAVVPYRPVVPDVDPLDAADYVVL